MADMWTDLDRWEADNNAVVFLVVGTQDIRESVREYNAFDKDNAEDYICEIDDVSEKIIFDALISAYNSLDQEYGLNYECIVDDCYETIVEKLNNNINQSIAERQQQWQTKVTAVSGHLTVK